MRAALDAIPLGIDSHQLELLPASLHYVLDSEIKLTAHDDRVGLSCQLVEKIERDRINLVVYVQTDTQL